MKNLLFIGQYNLDKLDSAPQVRIYNLHKEISEIINTDFITGTRKSRKKVLIKYLFSKKFLLVDYIYMESSTSSSSFIDIIFLIISKILNKKILIFIRDAYPIFGLIKKNSIKNILLIFSWYISHWFYKKLSNTLIFPTEGLCKVFEGVKKYEIIPPAGTSVEFTVLPKNEKGILYCGGLSRLYGVENLIDALEIVYKKNNKIIFYLVCRKNEINDNILKRIDGKNWIKLMHTNFKDVIKIRDKIYLCVAPSIKDPYTEINLHIKIFDYMSLSRPIVSTDGKEIVKFFSDNKFGLLCKSNIEDIADKITNLLENYEESQEISKRNYKDLNERNLWKNRAQKIVDIFSSLD